MPDTTDMSSVILELNAVATASGVEFISIAPQAPVAGEGGFLAVPIKLTFEGSYYDLTDFLFRLRNLVIVRDGELESSGRLFTLDALELHEGSLGFPQVQAAITLSAYRTRPPRAAVAPGTTPPATTTPAPAEDPAAAIGTDSRMARRNAADMQKAKEAKQKKLLLILLPFFLVLVAWQGPKMYKSLFAQPAPEATPAATTPSSTVPGTPTTAPVAPPADGLADSEPVPPPGATSSSPSAASPPAIRSSRPAELRRPHPGESAHQHGGHRGQRQSEEVVYGAAFPTADPVFRLANVTETGVEVGPRGSFDDGRQTVAISIGEQVQLVGDDGTTYTVRVVSVDFKPRVPGGSAEDCIGSS